MEAVDGGDVDYRLRLRLEPLESIFKQKSVTSTEFDLASERINNNTVRLRVQISIKYYTDNQLVLTTRSNYHISSRFRFFKLNLAF